MGTHFFTRHGIYTTAVFYIKKIQKKHLFEILVNKINKI
jgi:hypothetical protein